MTLPNNIVFSDNIEDDLKKFFSGRTYSKTAVLVDENTRKYCLPLIEGALPKHTVIEIISGEEHKNIDICLHIWDALTRAAFDRKSLLINLGGGVIGDMGGFCAATYKRGISFINIPTTLLAQVDASIGGKLGIDFKKFKNHIGLFKDPEKVFLDSVFFDTLSEAEMRSGFAEIIKHCLIRDADKFEEIAKTPYTRLDMAALVRHSVEIKGQVVTEDPTEKGLRKILNFGHTIGHAIESYYMDKPGKKLLHGEAVAIGMICEAFLSMKKLPFSHEELDKVMKYILSVYGGSTIPESDIEEIAVLTLQDKKNEGDKINCSLLTHIGDCTINIKIENRDVSSSIEYYNSKITAK